MADSSLRHRLSALQRRPLESYNKTWLRFAAVAVVAVVIAAMLVVHLAGAGYRRYTAEFLQAAALRAGNPIAIAGIPVGTVTSMKLVGDHVEAGLRIRDDVVLGKDSTATIRVTTILGSRYLAIEPDGAASLPDHTFDLAHTAVPYDLQAALKDATTTFEQVDSDRFAQSLTVLGRQLDKLPPVVPQAVANIDSLSSIIATRRDQLGQLLESTEQVTNTLRRQLSTIGGLVNQGQDLMGQFVARRAVFHAMMRSLDGFVGTLRQIIGDRPGVDALLKDMREFTGLLAQHDDLLSNLLQISPIFFREATNITGDGNAVNFNAPNGLLLVDSWMCAISGRAEQFGMIPYFKDCK